MKRRTCMECGAKPDFDCGRCGKPRCWGHLTARAVPGKPGTFRLVCRGECRLRRRAQCAALSPTGQRCRLPGQHEGPHQLHGWWFWEDGAGDYLPSPVSRGAVGR